MSPSESSTQTDEEEANKDATTTAIRFKPSTSSDVKIINQQSNFQIFLGGSCNPTTWRQKVAIPYLETNGITYYNPQVDNWTPEVVITERYAKQNAQVLLFVIDKQTRSTVSLIESAFMAGDSRKLVLVIYPFDNDIVSFTDATKRTSNIVETRSAHRETSLKKSRTTNQGDCSSSSIVQSSSTTISSLTTKHSSGSVRMSGETISLREFQELKQARFILQRLIREQGTPLFSDIPQALNYISQSLSDNKDIITDQQKKLASSSSKEKISGPDLDINLDHEQSASIHYNPVPGIADKVNNSKEMKDLYLSLDDDDSNLISTVIPILEERGLTFSCSPIGRISNPASALPKISIDSQISICNKHAPITISGGRSSQKSSQTLLETKPDHLFNHQGAQALALDDEMGAIRSSRVLLFVITNKCRGLSVMVLASHFMALFRDNVVLCIQYLEEPCSIGGETLTKSAIADYNRGRVYLCDYAIKSRVPVFSTIGEAIDCCSRKCGYTGNNKT